VNRLFPVALLGMLAAFAAACGAETGQTGTSVPADEATTLVSSETPRSLSIAYTAEEATYIAKALIVSSPPLLSSRPASLEYAESTAGRARALLDPDGSEAGWRALPDDAPVWVFVTSGEFVGINRFSGETRAFAYYWVIVPIGERSGGWTHYGTDPSKLGSLGTVVKVPGPLPTIGPEIDESP
jgi:hypothetical protein